MSRTTLAALAVTALVGLFGAPAAARAELPVIGAPGSPYASIPTPEGLAVGDFNGDGRGDVLVGNRDGDQKVALMLGSQSGALTAAPGSPFGTGHNLPVAVVAADMNGDGRLDAVTAASTGGNALAAVLLGDGAGGLTPAPGSPYVMNANGPNEEQQLGVADFDGDGRLDVVASHGGTTITTLRGTGGGALAAGVTSAAPVGTTSGGLTIADFTGDGKLDVLTGDEAALYKGVLYQNVGGTLTALTAVSGFGDNPSAGDLDGDGRADVVSTTTGPSDVRGFTVTGFGVFTPLPGNGFSAGFTFPNSTQLTDLDADGRLDLIIAGSGDGHLGLEKGSGAATFTDFPGFPVEIGSDNRFATTGDVNGDGQPDIVYTVSDKDRVGVILVGTKGGAGVPAAADFGSTPIGGATVDRTVTLTSDGTGFLAVRAATVTGANAADVTKVSDGCTGRSLAIGRTCDIVLRFAPVATGVRTAMLNITDNTEAGSHPVALSGQGTTVPTPTPDPTPHPKPVPDTTRPVVSRLGFSPRSFRVGRAATATSATKTKKAKTGTKLRFTLSEAAAVRIAIQRGAKGRRSGSTCKKPTRKLRKAKACTRYVTVGTLKRTGRTGRTTVAFSGRIGTRKLAKGGYRASITAKDGAGNATATAAIRTFKIVAG